MPSFTPQPLALGIHLAWVGEDVVVLNTTQDRYACLVSGASFLTPSDTPGTVAIRDDVLDQLLTTGWIDPHLEPSARKPSSQPRRVISASPGMSLRAFVGVASNAVAGEGRFRSSTFSDLLRSAERYRRQVGQTRTDKPAARALVGQFFTVLPWLPGQGLCLHRSFMLLRYLARHDIVCDWVFGVRTWPFAAHCWLVIEDAVLGDELDRVRAFTPILVV